MGWFRRAAGGTSGSTVTPNVLPPGMALDTVPNRKVGPGGGHGWGTGPRWFVGKSRAPATATEVGLPGDFPEGEHSWGPREGDLGFPHATRSPGYPGSWEPPFFDTGGRGPTGASAPLGGFAGGGSVLTGRISTVFACSDLCARTLGTMGLTVTRDGQPVDAPPWTENPEPEIYSSMVDALKAVVNSLLHRGETMIVPTARYADGSVARWVALNPDVVDVEAGVGGLPLYSLGGVPIPRGEILHIRYQVWPGTVRGVGPLEACLRNLASADALQEWGTQLATMNGIPMAVLQAEMKLTKDQVNDLKASWTSAAMSRGIAPAVLTGGLTYTPLNLKPAEVGLLDLRMFDEQRIASCFGVPLWLVGLPVNDGLTYSTVTDTFDYFWRATLRPLAYNIAQALSGWALPRSTSLRFNSETITEPSMTDRANIYSTLISAGVMTPAEARAKENLPPLPNLDVPPLTGLPMSGGAENPGV